MDSHGRPISKRCKKNTYKSISTGAPNIVAGSSAGTTLVGAPPEASFVVGGPSHTGEPNKTAPIFVFKYKSIA